MHGVQLVSIQEASAPALVWTHKDTKAVSVCARACVFVCGMCRAVAQVVVVVANQHALTEPFLPESEQDGCGIVFFAATFWDEGLWLFIVGATSAHSVSVEGQHMSEL